MNSNSNLSILQENNSDVDNYFESNENDEKTRLIINHESTSDNLINSIYISNSNKSNLSSKFYQKEKSKLKNNYRIICKDCYNFT